MNIAMNSKPISTQKLKQLKRQLAAWRRTARPRQAIPEPLWQAAAALAQSLGVSPVARALQLNYGALKRRVCSCQPTPTLDPLVPGLELGAA
jgi:hypothetical protein